MCAINNFDLKTVSFVLLVLQNKTYVGCGRAEMTDVVGLSRILFYIMLFFA